MTPKFTTRDIDKAYYSNYLKRAEECLHAAQNSFIKQEWNASTINQCYPCLYLGMRRNVRIFPWKAPFRGKSQ